MVDIFTLITYIIGIAVGFYGGHSIGFKKGTVFAVEYMEKNNLITLEEEK